MNDEQSICEYAAEKSFAESSQSLTIRKYDDGDERGILTLRKMIFGHADLDEWTWEFENSPLGSIMLVAESGNRIVGFNAYLLIAMKIGDKSVKGSISCELMVHPDFRRRGLWHKMARMLWEEAKRKGVVIRYSLPNKTTLKNRLSESTYVGDIPILVKFFDTYGEIRKRVRSQFLARLLSFSANAIFKAFLAKAERCPTIQNLVLSEITGFDTRINSFWEKASTAFKISIIRDKQYLNWRYFQRPNSNFRILMAEEENRIFGYIVFSVKRTDDERIGYIIDVMTLPDNPEVTQILIMKAVETLEKEKVSKILCMMMKNNEYYKIFRKNGFMRMPHALLGYSLKAQADPSEVSEDFRDPDNWYLTLGDTDGIVI